jgi:F-type H+-transporting ATPase subunit gamma
MARSLRDIRRKMKAIRSTRQVTKAMELVAASKMRKAVQNTQMLRRYARTASRILESIAEVHPDLHPYLTERPSEKILAVLFTSDRGLCGSLNAQLFRAGISYIRSLKNLPSFQSLEWIAVGKKGQQFLARSGESVTAAFPALSNHPTFQDTLPIVRLITEGFVSGKYDQVVLVYTDFVSALLQESTVKVLLPFSKTALKEMLESLLPKKGSGKREAISGKSEVKEYLFEPSQSEILKVILPQLTEVQVYQAVLEAAASEHSARMVAMRNASDNASDILDDLTLTANQTRQAGITAEISEISGAKAALES